ncbi:flagellar export chaperone FlgN [Bacillus mycoides]|uniref:flagellar export chaperone FlgN n=1 Tax=Bacillus mycoides TaxID=1405 RepID=UPI0036E7A214
MYIQLYEKLVIIQKAYENIQTLGEQIYENLKNKNVNAVQKLQVEQLQYIEGVKGLSRSFEEMVVQLCKEKQVEPLRMRSLFSYFSQEENEKMEELQKKLNELEENVKMILLKNQYYLNVLLKTTESIVDSVSEYNLEKNNNSQIFMNELL